MIIKSLQLKRALRSVLLVLLLSAVGMGKMDAQEFTAGDLNYSVNSDGASVTIMGTTITSNSESFENGIPSDWTTIDADGDDNTWDIGWSGNSHSGAMYVISLSYSNFALTPDNYLVSGQISFTSNTGIRFYVHSNAIQHFGVAISTRSQNNAIDFTTIAEWTVTTEGDWIEYSVDLSSYAGQMGWIAIRHFDCMGQGSYSGLVVDDVCVGEDYDTPPHSYSLSIPESVFYDGVSYAVTAIGNYAFYNCNFFTGNLIIPNSVITIGNWAFGYCSGFTGSLTIPNSVTSIGEAAFAFCHGFTGSLTISNFLTSIGNSAFSHCSGFTGSLTIPNSVTSIGNYAFYDCSGFIGDLVIPDSVISLGDDAFEQCSGFTGSLTIGNSVTMIGGWVFSSCNGFTGSLTIGNSVTSIGRNAFYDCNGLTGELTIPNSVTEIGDMAFAYCHGFTGSLSIPNSVTTIGSAAFIGCNGFTGSITIPNSVTEISEDAFRSCGFTGSLTIPNSVTEIGHFAFAECRGFTENLTIGSSVTTIDYEAFASSGFTSITSLSETPPMLGVDVFRSCDLDIPVFVPCGYVEEYLSLPWGEFSNFIGLCGDSATVTVKADPEEYGSVTGGGVFEVGQTCPVTAVANEGYVFSHWTKNGIIMASDNTEYTFYVTGDMILVAHFVPDGNIVFADANVKSICVSRWDNDDDGELSYIEAASVKTLNNVFLNNTEITSFDELQYFIGLSSIDGFDGCSGLTSVILPNSIMSIGIVAFRNCSGLMGSLIIPNSVTSIGAYAFQYCSGLTSLTIGNSVTTIGVAAFDYCNGFIGALTIPNSVTTIGNAAFYYCNGFTGSLNIPNSVTYIGNQAFSGCSGFTGDLVIPNSVTEIGSSAFSGCSGFTGSLTIPNSVISIDNWAFSYCSGFTGDLIIPNSVTEIGSSAFSGCSGFTGSLAIPNSVTSIGNSAFSYCSGFTGDLVIPNSVTEIGSSAFSGCSGFTGSLTIPNSVITIGSSAFSGCSGLTGGLVIPNSVTTIGEEAFRNCLRLNGGLVIPNSVTEIGYATFYGCSGFRGGLVIPNSVTTIGDYAFYGCSGFIGSLTIPNSVTTIGDYAFYGCYRLAEAIMYNSDPPSLGGNTFSSISFLNTNYPIYVPYESLNAYKTATNWSNYEARLFPMAYTTVAGYGEGEGNYRFIASPLVENTAPTAVDNMITETAYDLYRFDQSENDEWQNYKYPENTPYFFLTNGQGYLYANAEDVNLVFKGEFNEDDTKEVGLAYDATATFAGWNLVGNPFPVNAYANKSYYTMNEEGTAVEPNMVSSATSIPACTGVMVMAESEGETVVFSTEAPEAATNQGCLQIAVAQTNERGTSTGSVTALDKAILSFNAGDRLEKFVFNMENAVISIPQGGKDFAIACTDKQGKMPLNFKATKNGEYTLTIHPEAVELDYLHLIDNLTGADVDLLVSPAYTFTAKTTDYASRFRLVFSGNEADGPSTSSGTFAFISNGNIIITDGPSTGSRACILQIVDMQGHIIVSTDAARNVSTCGIVPGVYVLRLINGDDVKTQKIVVR